MASSGVFLRTRHHAEWRREELGLLDTLDIREVQLAAGAAASPRHRVVGAGGLLGRVERPQPYPLPVVVVDGLAARLPQPDAA
jgi:hypothetical protein